MCDKCYNEKAQIEVLKFCKNHPISAAKAFISGAIVGVCIGVPLGCLVRFLIS